MDGLVTQPTTWTWDEMHALAPSAFSGDIHCVTTWSKLDVHFGGVSVDTLLDITRPLPEARFVMARSHTGYTTNLPLADVTGGKAWVVWDYDGRPLPAEHGGPARLLRGMVERIGPQNAIRWRLREGGTMRSGLYRVILAGTGQEVIKSVQGVVLDGDPRQLPSGDNTPGGDFIFHFDVVMPA